MTARTALRSQLPNPLLEALISRAVFAGQSAERLSDYQAALEGVRTDSADSAATSRLEAERQRLEALPVQPTLGANAALLHALFTHAADVVFRVMTAGEEPRALVVYLLGIINEQSLERSVLDPLVRAAAGVAGTPGLEAQLWGNESPNKQVQPVRTIGEAADAVLRGDTVVLVDGCDRGARLATAAGTDRQITEPPSEMTIRGPREGFVEHMRTNVALLRRRVRSPHLRVEVFTLGRKSRTEVSLVYLEGVTKPGIIREVRQRIGRVDIDALQSSGMLEEYLQDNPHSVFPQIFSTERPDRVAASLLEGQVTVIVDGTPFALVMPAVFVSFMTASEDYKEKAVFGTVLLWLRVSLQFLALVGPAVYVAVVSFHLEMLPGNLLLSVASARNGIPFPALLETLLLDTFFEALREAGVRLPRTVGQAVSIVGALVIGDAIVRAGLASTTVVIVVAATGIASFTVPLYSMGLAIRLLRFLMTLAAGALGLVGIALGLIAVLLHMSALRSFGVPYLQPIAPLSPSDLKDTLVRVPAWLLGTRPVTFGAVNRRRQAQGLKPGREEQGP